MALPLVFSTLSIVTTTVDSAEVAQHIAQGAVQAQLAACVQVECITSHYMWQGQLTQSAEWRLVCKTLPQAVDALFAWLRTAHPYEVPQLLVRSEQADAAYAAWVADSLAIKK